MRCALFLLSQIEHSLISYTALCFDGEKIVEICQKGDKLLDEEIAKVYKGKKIAKGKSILSWNERQFLLLTR